MVEERGFVIKKMHKGVLVSIPREVKCNGCKHCVMAQDGLSMQAKAENKIGAEVGDFVLIRSSDINQVSDGFLLFIAPLIMAFIGYSIGNIFFGRLLSLLSALIFTAVPILYLKLNKKYQMRVEEILKTSNQ